MTQEMNELFCMGINLCILAREFVMIYFFLSKIRITNPYFNFEYMLRYITVRYMMALYFCYVL